jgi:hypothetical protein|tara:strand:- start:1629 stop:2024 length:396 start_codon:yes stop_codon:yes gene_type:complete
MNDDTFEVSDEVFAEHGGMTGGIAINNYLYWCSKKGNEPARIGELGIDTKTKDIWAMIAIEPSGTPVFGKMGGMDETNELITKAYENGEYENQNIRRRRFRNILFTEEMIPDAVIAVLTGKATIEEAMAYG